MARSVGWKQFGIVSPELSPLAAWRRYRGLNQAALARKAELSQLWVRRIEKGGSYGSREMRRKLAAALDAPVWTLEDETSILALSPESSRNLTGALVR